MSTETAKTAMSLEKANAILPTEIGATAASAETQALIQARFIMALKKPRNMEQVRLDILKECKRPNFVRETEEGKGNSALYRRPVGGGKSAEGLGIRFVEMALQCMGNNLVDSFTVQESDTERVLHIFALDIEKNNSWGKTITLSKTVERKYLKDGEVPIRQRLNSQNQTVYVLPSDEGSFTTKESAEISKSSRTLGLRLIPGDIQDQAIKTIRETRYSEIQEDPDAAMRRVIDGMAKQNVSVIMLEGYLSHPVAQITPAQIVDLQGLYASLRDGETTWAEIMRDIEEERKAPKPKVESKLADKGVEAAKEKIRQEQASTPAVAQPTQAPTPESSSAIKDICGSCGITDVPMAMIDGVHLCLTCQPKPIVVPPVVETAQPAPAATAATAPPPVVTVAPAAAPPPWARPKPVAQAAPVAQPTAQVQPEPASSALSLEDEVANLATAKTEPAKPRIKPTNALIKKVRMPEFVDRTSAADAWTPEQYARVVTAFSSVPGIASDFTDAIAEQGFTKESWVLRKLGNSVKDWTGLPIEEINNATLETLINILENFTNKEGLKAWAISKGLYAGE